MEIIIYLFIFITGTVFGSFYTLAVHRIPKRQDILYSRSYCPNCNHKLGFFDLLPIISYISLKGRCRYCKEKIRPRYLIIESLSGILFVLIALAIGINMETLNWMKVAQFVFMVLYITFIILMCGVDKEYRKMNKRINIYGIGISILYMIYLCIVEHANIYRYGIYLVAYLVILLFDTITLAEYEKSTYVDGILLALVTMLVFSGEYATIASVILTLLTIAIYLILYKIKNKTKDKKITSNVSNKLSIGYFLGISNIIVVLCVALSCQYMM